MRFCQPNLPKNMAKICVLSGRNKPVVQALEARGIQCYLTRPSKRISQPVADHTDMLSLLVRPGKILLSSDQKELQKRLTSAGVEVISFNELNPGYPDETALNNLILGNQMIGGPAAAKNLARLQAQKLEFSEIRQGYTRCSAVPVQEKAVITADRNLGRLLQELGFDVLEIEPEKGIQLKGYAYGFLGGSCGKISLNELAFCGDFSLLNQSQQIEAFLKKYDVKPISLCQGPIHDIGGIVAIAE